MRPLIGIISGIGSYEERERFYVNSDYVEAVTAAGGLPFLIPPVAVESYLPLLQGLLLPGGIDLDPGLYGEEPKVGLGQVNPKLDQAEQTLVKAALEAALPIFGICRGMQALVVATGGALYQDLEQSGIRLAHRQTSPPHCPWHKIKVAAGSRLESLLGAQRRVNSFHHQGARKLAGLRSVAWSSDGLVEAVEGEPFVLGVQWHPEMMWKTQPEQLELFRAFVEASDVAGNKKR
jgi:putative glutamine amidotransferase